MSYRTEVVLCTYNGSAFVVEQLQENAVAEGESLLVRAGGPDDEIEIGEHRRATLRDAQLQQVAF